MKIAATYEKETGNVFQHFGKTQYFKIYEIEDGKILSSEVIDNGGNGHHALPPFLKSLGVETLILGNRGQGAIDAIAAAGLKEVPGITGSADEAAEKFAKGQLKGNFEATKQPKNLQKANSKATLKPGAITTASIIITKKWDQNAQERPRSKIL